MNPAAHGGHTETEICRCGHVRFINVRGGERERGPWVGGFEFMAAQHFRQSAARAPRRAADKLEAAGDMREIQAVLRHCVSPALAEFKAYMKPDKSVAHASKAAAAPRQS